MAHELEEGEIEESVSSLNDDHTRNKVLLNRRDYVQLGAAAVAATLGTGIVAGASDGDDGATDTYVTDFSGYSL